MRQEAGDWVVVVVVVVVWAAHLCKVSAMHREDPFKSGPWREEKPPLGIIPDRRVDKQHTGGSVGGVGGREGSVVYHSCVGHLTDGV